jgi:branched-chain amino acid transport system ATP-binding protein
MLLEMREVTAGYLDKPVLNGVSLQIVAMVGHNGAGKSTILRTILGLISPYSGAVWVDGRDVSVLDPSEKVKAGVCLVPQGSNTFPDLSVAENLELSLAFHSSRGRPAETLRYIYGLFPALERRKRQSAGSLSGGERQMLAISIALVKRPRLLLLDEPSLGLAPVLVTRLMDTIGEINRQLRTAVLLAEQNVTEAFRIARRAYVIHTGEVLLSDSTENLIRREDLFSLV